MVSACTVSGQPDWNSLKDKMKLTKMQKKKANVDLIGSHWALLLCNKTHFCMLREHKREMFNLSKYVVLLHDYKAI